MTVNVELLDRAVEFVRESAKTGGKGVPVEIEGNGVQMLAWYQELWSVTAAPEGERSQYDEFSLEHAAKVVPDCGTGCCVAGWVAHVTGAKPRYYPIGAYRSAADVEAEGDVWSVREYAMTKLGLNETQGSVLFDGGNRVSDIEKIAEAIKAGAGDGELWELSHDLIRERDAAAERAEAAL